MTSTLCALFSWALLAGANAATAPSPTATPYDPLAISTASNVATVDLTVHDTKRKRDLPLRVYLPTDTTPAAVALFSHGLGGSCMNNAFLGEHWAARGYLAVFIQHPGSDESVWKNTPPAQRLAAMQKAANLSNTMLRIKDIPAVIDQLERWNRTEGHPLRGRMDLSRIGMSGHSFGAVTTQFVGGQRSLGGRVSFADRRIKAAIAFSPSSPRQGNDPQKAFDRVSIPWMLMTGTRDVAIIGDATVESRLAVFPALPPGGKYELVLEGAEHSAFSERALPGDTAPRNPNHHRVIRALSTAFWDAYLREDPAARAWLDGQSPAALLEKGDRWRKK